MVIETLMTIAERQAQKAEDLPAFSGIKLLHIKRQVAELLNLIGHNGIFDEYTHHDISHIDEMLKILDWLVPDETKAIMSPADWLLTVLAIYFHDLGMLVTTEEYERRNSSGFPEYRDKVLFHGDYGTDYRAKVEELPPTKGERFLYQEFVRHKHAERIRDWIMGRASQHLGVTHAVMSEVDTLLGPLNSQFRRDLALICESHHLDDLNDFRKYKVSQPYGNSDAETANLQYIAILLRTADLLHVTSDRTPSIAFRIINPTDPISQEEWAKQMAVRRVRSQFGHDREGATDEKAPRDTIEVHAYFTKENGFFGLTSYLIYAQDQIRKSYEWIQASNSQQGTRHQFPWRYIDDSNIETEGFLRDTFEFTIDQARILDLLTGHTLYNDTRVVLRELAQNALDAIRLQQHINKRYSASAETGRLKIHWDSRQRMLSIEDNGTGMTQSIIERHLLKVGASRYQDPDFRRQYPGFSAISRFGIGLLSTFMIADNVEIITCHPEDDQARQLSLRSVHGKYLIRLLDKQTDAVAKHLAPHGTLVKLKVRPSADVMDILETARRWIVIPNCEVIVTVDDADPVPVGFASPREALLEVLQRAGIMADSGAEDGGTHKIHVEQTQLGGVTLAYVVTWNEYFKEWSFLSLREWRARVGEQSLPWGTCIEGVRVEFDTPGFDGRNIVALANVQGLNAPKTNVVRSGLEATPEREAMLRAIYTMYCDHVRNEICELHVKRQFSLTWATQESRYLLLPLFSHKMQRERFASAEEKRVEPLNSSLLTECAAQLPVLLVERDNQRQAMSPMALSQEQQFWTIDSAFFRFAEMLIREVTGSASLTNLVTTLQGNDVNFPDSPVLCGFSSDNIFDQSVFGGREVNMIRVYPAQRRIDLRWAQCSEPPRWRRLGDEFRLAWDALPSRNIPPFGALNPRGYYLRSLGLRRLLEKETEILVGQGDIETPQSLHACGIRTFGTTFLFPDSGMARYIVSWLDRMRLDSTETLPGTAIISFLTGLLSIVKGTLARTDDVVRDGIQEINDALELQAIRIEDRVDMTELYGVIENTYFEVFDPSAWSREQLG